MPNNTPKCDSEWPPRLIVEWDTDNRILVARRPLGEKGAGNYLSRAEHEATLREREEKIAALEKFKENVLVDERTWQQIALEEADKLTSRGKELAALRAENERLADAGKVPGTISTRWICLKVHETEITKLSKENEKALRKREYESYRATLRVAEICTKQELVDYLKRVIKQEDEALVQDAKGTG